MQKKYFRFITKITLTDEPKYPYDKIKANQAEYDLDREGAKISGSSYNELDKDEQLRGKEQLKELNVNISHQVKLCIKY